MPSLRAWSWKKPLGTSLETSREINDQVGEFFEECQVYRIDHYLGKETVLNLLALRFANSLFVNNSGLPHHRSRRNHRRGRGGY